MEFAKSRGFVVRATLIVLGASLVGFSGCAATCGSGLRAEGGAQAASPAVATAPPTPRPVAVGLPNPPGPANLPRPSGSPGNLKVLDWAGFKSAVSYTLDDGQPSQIEHYAELQATVKDHLGVGSSAAKAATPSSPLDKLWRYGWALAAVLALVALIRGCAR